MELPEQRRPYTMSRCSVYMMLSLFFTLLLHHYYYIVSHPHVGCTMLSSSGTPARYTSIPATFTSICFYFCFFYFYGVYFYCFCFYGLLLLSFDLLLLRGPNVDRIFIWRQRFCWLTFYRSLRVRIMFRVACS